MNDFEWFKEQYDISLYDGQALLFYPDGMDKPAIKGLVKGVRGQYVKVKLESKAKAVFLHPTWNITYS
ncbi:hypothetical protein [Psychrobacter sp. W2-37-MNA-CIBAN-0211]|uniref:hypothetical protein n=1 Tax=Psychrobacter sp. W2-37-MNA-CIBAN-0211 TaxID=3140443 RepID=UPI00332E2895